MRRIRGVAIPHNKNTETGEARVLPTPAEVTIPMAMHIGAPAIPVVSAGDEVKVGQLIGEAYGFVSASVHASVSGRVKSINDRDFVTGQKAASVTITADGEQTAYEELVPPPVANLPEFLDAVRNSGVVGLGGAAFPSAVKLTIGEPGKLEYILVNGAECEPYITSDSRTMVDDAELIREGIQLLRKFFGVNIIICIENNKPAPIKNMRKIADSEQGVEVRVLPAKYPQGGEKVLIYTVTGRVVPEGGLPIDAGLIVLNCTTVAAIARYIKTGMPLVSKCVTVDGPAVKDPGNVIAPIGAPVRELIKLCGGLGGDIKKVLLGGPMMGVAIPSLDMPVLKSTNAILAFGTKDARISAQTACIRCGRCIANCPMSLMALEIERAYLLKKPEMLERYKVNLCMECGCCDYVCPAQRPLVQTIKLAKSMLRDLRPPQQKAAEENSATKERKEAEE